MTEVSVAPNVSRPLDNGGTSSGAYLPGPEYYLRALCNGRNREEIVSRYGEFIEDVTSVEYSPLPYGGFSSRTRLYRVTLRDLERRNLPLELLLKVAYPGFDVVDTSKRHHVGLSEAMDYQYAQMKFWNSAGLPAPLVLDLSQEEHHGVDHFYLAMEYWDGTTHDLNVLALNQYARNTLQNGKNQQSFVGSERDKVIRSSLETIRRFHVVGTKEARYRGIQVFVPEDLHQYFVEDRGRFYFDKYLRLKSARVTGINGSEETLDQFCRFLLPLLEPLFERQRFLYSQGDEYLHHLQYRQPSNGHKVTKVTGIFDSDHVMMMRPEYSFAKLLTSHLLGLDFETELAYVESTFLSPGAPQGERYNKLVSERSAIRDYILVSLATRLFDIGKRASHALRDDQINARFVAGVTFRPHKIEFPLREYVPPSVSYPTVGDSIAVQIGALQDRLTRVEEGELNRVLHPRDRENVKKLQQFLTENRLL